MATEPFPAIDAAPASGLQAAGANNLKLRTRNKSSSLGGDPRGDTGAPAVATSHLQRSSSSEGSPIAAQKSLKSNADRPARRSKRKRVRSYLQRYKKFSLRHTWFNPLIICLAVAAAYLVNPTTTNPVYPALFISYPLGRSASGNSDAQIQYGKGRDDFKFVAFYTIFLSFTREFIMQRLLRPLALHYGIRSREKQSRFMEQAYTAVYFSIFGPFGLYVMSRTDLWFFNTEAMYADYPHYTHDALFKAYYLLQASYWAQQFLVLIMMLEKPRKDFKELVAHHVITLALIWLSYRFHFTRIGLPVYITHDISDFFLAIAKVLNYIDSPITIPWFVTFLGAWTYLRHYHNLRILASILPLENPFPDHIAAVVSDFYNGFTSTTVDQIVKRLPDVLRAPLWKFFHGPWPASQFATVGEYELNWVTQQYKCYISQWITFGLLAGLQCLNIFWFFLILRVLYRMVKTMGQEKVDERSEYDSDEEDERKEELEKLRKEQNGSGKKN